MTGNAFIISAAFAMVGCFFSINAQPPHSNDADQPVESVTEIQPTNQSSKTTSSIKKQTIKKKHAHKNITSESNAPIRHRFAQQHQNLIQGFIQTDGILFGPNANQFRSNGNVRRARLFYNTVFNPNWQTSIAVNLAEQYFINNFYVSYTDLKHIGFILGQYSPDFGLNNSVATLANTLLESPMAVYTLSPEYSYAASIQLFNSYLTYNIGANGSRVGQTVVGHMPIDITTRISFVPIHTTRDVIDTGISSRWQYPDGKLESSFGAIPDIYTASQNSFINTPIIDNTNFYQVYDLEAAWEHGSLEMQGEYLGTHVYRSMGLPTEKFYGYYLLVNYFLTGESRVFEYPAAYYSGISKIHHSYGAWELATQFDNFSLNSVNINGGTEHNAVLGLNWYTNQNLELQFNYVHAWFQTPNSIQNNQANIYALRLQYAFM